MKRVKYSQLIQLVAILAMLFSLAGQIFYTEKVWASSGESTDISSQEDKVLSVNEAIALNNSGAEITVEGYIVGFAKGNQVFADNNLGDTNLVIADSREEKDQSLMLFVQLPNKNNFRFDFGLASNPHILGRKIRVTGKNERYFSQNGLKNPSAIAFADEASSDDYSEVEESEKVEGNTSETLNHEIQTISQARQQQTGSARVGGVVTARLKNTIIIQDSTAGIAVRPTSLDVQVGEQVVVSGQLQDYNGLLQLNQSTLEEKSLSELSIDPQKLMASDLVNHQSELAIIEDVEIIAVNDGGSWANYTAKDSAGNRFIIRDELGRLNLSEGHYDSITGIVSTFNQDQQIIPRNSVDIIADSTRVQPVESSIPAGLIPSGSEITLSTSTPRAQIYYTLDGSDPTQASQLYTEPIIIQEDSTLKAFAIAEGFDPSEIQTFDYQVYDHSEGIRIHHIQGQGHVSPFNGRWVDHVEGVVTYKYAIRGANYFHMQTPDGQEDDNLHTSEGIVVYTGRAEEIQVGDLVRVSGQVSEYYIDGYDDKNKTDLSVTQINARNDRGGQIEVAASDQPLPTARKITSGMIPKEISAHSTFDVFEPEKYAIDFWESIEGMRVEISPSRAVAPQQHGDLVVVTEDFPKDQLTFNGGVLLTPAGPNAQSIQFKVYPNDLARDLKVKTGDLFTESLSGVVNYGFGNYKVYVDLDEVVKVHEVVPENREKPQIKKDENKLTIATYNVENFSANNSANETPDEKVAYIAHAFVRDMQSPDIIGIVEVMANNGQASTTSEASATYQRLITAIIEAGGPEYDYLNIDPEFNQDGGAPGGNIRVGYLYNPDRVRVIDAPHGDHSTLVGYEKGKLTHNPGRITSDSFQGTRKPLVAQFEFQGETVVVINNHLNSKRGDTPYFGQTQPPVMGSEPRRHQLASEVNTFIRDILADNPEENIIVLGDMNDYQFSDTLNILAGDELTNLINLVPEEQRYTYIYQGNSQVLDHILVSKDLAAHAEIDIVHVNADYTPMHGRASDHEPVVAQIDLRKEKLTHTETETEEDKREGTENSEIDEEPRKASQESGDGQITEEINESDNQEREVTSSADPKGQNSQMNTDDYPKELPALVEFKLQDGKVFKRVETKTGEWITLPEAPAKQGYRFLYWGAPQLSQGTQLKVEETNYSLTAVYEKIEKDDQTSSEDNTVENNKANKQQILPRSGFVVTSVFGIGLTIMSVGVAITIRQKNH